jgi:hypothetical protein
MFFPQRNILVIGDRPALHAGNLVRSGDLSVNATNILLETARGQELHSKNQGNGRHYPHHGPSASTEIGEMLRRYEQERPQPNMPRRATVKSKRRFSL